MLKLFGKILRLSGEYKTKIQMASVLAFIESILSKMPIVFAFYTIQKLYENTMTAKDCLLVGIFLGITVFVQMLIHYLSDSLQSGAGYMMFAKKRLELGGHLRKLPMGYFTSGGIGKISSVLSSDMIFIEEVAMSTIANMMSNIFSIIILNVFMFVLNTWIGVISLAVTLLAVIVSKTMNKVSLKEAKIRQEQGEDLTNAVLSFAGGIGVIKSYNLLGEKSNELTDNFKKSMDTSLTFEKKMAPWTTGLNILYAVGMGLIIFVSINLFQSNQMDLPYLIGMMLFVFNLFGPIKVLYGEATRFTVMDAALDRIQEVFDEAELSNTGTESIPEQTGKFSEVEFDNVSFFYGDKEVINGVTFKVKPNTMTAFVGPSGGGKTTLVNLLARFWDVSKGTIKIRGVDIKDVPLADLMNHISMVFQRVYLFQDTIYNNILMGKPNATREEVIEAAKRARCYDFIMNLPEQFETVIGEGGQTLSGGEKQRISIARCILKDAPIIILDEATASVDVDNESYIQEALLELIKGKTLLVIAHRLYTIREADQIIVIKDGQISEKGKHEELMKQGGVYCDFINRTQKSNTWTV